MNCIEFDEKISLYIDDQLDSFDRKEFELHLLECDSCREEYEEMINILKYTAEMEEVELPDNYRSTLRKKLEEETSKTRYARRFNWRVLSSVAAGLLLLVVGYGIVLDNFSYDGIKEQSMDNAAPETQYSGDYGDNRGAMEQDEGAKFAADEAKDIGKNNYTATPTADKEDVKVEFSNSLTSKTMRVEDTGRKIIKDAFVTIESSEFDRAFNDITSHVKAIDGYIEMSETSYYNTKKTKDQNGLRIGSIRLRIPEEHFFTELEFIKSKGDVIQQQSNERDVSKDYYDTENHVKNLELQEERLREILGKATNVDEILKVENELRRIRTEIDEKTQTLQNWDSLVDYSTITINLIEVKDLSKGIEIGDEGILTNGKKGFISTINKIIGFVKKAIISLMTIAPILIIILAGVTIVYILVRRYLRHRK